MRRIKRSRGQSAIEYILMVGFAAIFSIQVMKFFNGVFQEGLVRLEGNIQSEVATGQRFGGGQ